MKLPMSSRNSGEKKVVSRTDAVFTMIAAVVAAVGTTFMTVNGIIESFTGPVTLTLPLQAVEQSPAGLAAGAAGRFTAMEATIPSLPGNEAALLAWGAILNQVSLLAVMALLFLLALRLIGENLFTPASVWILGASGVVLAAAGYLGQLLDAIARNRIAELIGANQRSAGDTVGFVAEFNSAPLLVGIVLVLIAGVFQFGRRLQKDIEGLI